MGYQVIPPKHRNGCDGQCRRRPAFTGQPAGEVPDPVRHGEGAVSLSGYDMPPNGGSYSNSFHTMQQRSFSYTGIHGAF